MTDRHQEHVQAALEWEPSVDVAEVGVTVDEGVVTLRGEVKSYAEKAVAERVTLGVCGVKAVANDLTVGLLSGLDRTDSDIAMAAVNALQWNSLVPRTRSPLSLSEAGSRSRARWSGITSVSRRPGRSRFPRRRRRHE